MRAAATSGSSRPECEPAQANPAVRRRTASDWLLKSTALGLSLGYLAAGPSLLSQAYANPIGGSVSSGAATIQTAPNTVTINQQSDRAVIDWRGFNIGKGETTQFNQPSQSSTTLNRVNSTSASTIDGNLKANGNVFLVNPNGVIIGSGARIDVGGLIATTADIRNENFKAGRYLFDQPSPNGGATVQNAGTITVRDKGLAALVAPAVSNTGTITANMGEVTLAGTKTFAVDMYGDGLLAFAVGSTSTVTERPKNPDGSAVEALVSNSGTIVANGGKVQLTANAAAGVLDQAINNSGRIEARSVAVKNGVVILSGQGSGSVITSGSIDASGTGTPVSTGGTIKVLGETVALADGAHLDVSGNAGGGTALVGGNFHGAGPERNAKRTYVAPSARVTGDALLVGDGAKVAIWSDEVTQFFGSVSAKGGTQGGDGGFAEVSSKQNLSFAGLIDLRGPFGKNGTLLLDPASIELTNGANGSVQPPLSYADDPGGTDQILPSDVANLLNTTNVVLQATNNITVTNGLTSTSGNSLTLQADGSININDPITLSGALILSSPTVTIATSTAAIGTASNPIQIQDLVTNAGTVRTSTTLAANTGNQNLFVTEQGGDLVIPATAINAGTGAVGLTAAGSISGAAGAFAGITAASANLVALGTAAGSAGSVILSSNIRIAGAISGSSKGDFTFTNGVLTTPTPGTTTSLGPLTVGGNLSVTSYFPIVNPGALQVAGTSTFDAFVVTSFSTVSTYGPTSITLDNPGNSFTGAVALSGANPGGSGPSLTAATVNSTTALTLSASPVTGALTLSAPSIAQSAALTVGGNLTATGTSGPVNLGTAGNSFTGTVSVPNATVATITNSAATNVGTVTAASLTLASGGAITGGSAVTLSGALALSAGSITLPLDISLSSTANRISGPISVSAARNVTIVNGGPSVLGPITNGGTFSLTSAGAVTSSGAIRTGGDLLVTETSAGVDVSLDNAGNAITGTVSLQSGGGGSVGNATIVNGSALTLGTIAVSGSFSAQAPSILVKTPAGSITAGQNVTLTTNQLTLAGPVTGAGSLTIQPMATTTTIGVGDGASGTLSLGSTAIAQIGTNFASVVIGRADGSGAIDVESATFRNPLVLRSPAAGGSIYIGGFLTGTGPASLTLLGSGGTTTLAGNMTTSGQAITINDRVLLANDVTLSTTGGGSTVGAAVTITGAVDAAASGTAPPGTTSTLPPSANRSLTVNAGSRAVSTGAIGQTAAPVAVVFNGGSITVPAVTTAPGTSTLSPGQRFTASSISLTGANYLTGGGVFSAVGATTLGATATVVDTRVGRATNGAGGNITLSGQISGPSLTLAAGTGQANASTVALGALTTRDTLGSSSITGTVAGASGIDAAPLVSRPDGISTAYLINGCVQGVSCAPVVTPPPVTPPPVTPPPVSPPGHRLRREWRQHG